MTTEQDVETVRRLLAFIAEEGLTSKQTRVEAEKALSRLVKELDRPPCSLQLHDTWIARIASLEAERDRLRREVEASRYPEDFVDRDLRDADLARLRRIEEAAKAEAEAAHALIHDTGRMTLEEYVAELEGANDALRQALTDGQEV